MVKPPTSMPLLAPRGAPQVLNFILMSWRMCMRGSGGGQAPRLHASLGAKRGTPSAEFLFDVVACVYVGGGGVVKPPAFMPLLAPRKASQVLNFILMSWRACMREEGGGQAPRFHAWSSSISRVCVGHYSFSFA